MKKSFLIMVIGLMVISSSLWAQTETYEFVTEWGSLGSGDGKFGYD